jgi:hypothetical protein
MTPRRLIFAFRQAVAEAPALAPLGPRQVGAVTLALEPAMTGTAACLDLKPSAN